MKKYVALIFLSLFFLNNYTFSQSTASLRLSATIAQSIKVSTNIVNIAPSTIILGTAQSILLGSIDLNFGLNTNYVLTVTSQNGGIMRSTESENNEILPYTLTFAGVEGIDLSSGFQMQLATNSDLENMKYPIWINFPKKDPAEEPVAAGMYEDYILITISVA